MEQLKYFFFLFLDWFNFFNGFSPLFPLFTFVFKFAFIASFFNNFHLLHNFKIDDNGDIATPSIHLETKDRIVNRNNFLISLFLSPTTLLKWKMRHREKKATKIENAFKIKLFWHRARCSIDKKLRHCGASRMSSMATDFHEIPPSILFFCHFSFILIRIIRSNL